MIPLIKTARWTALKWDVSQCLKTNTFWVLFLYVQIEKIKKWTYTNHTFENLSTACKNCFDLGPKRYLGRRASIIGNIIRWGGRGVYICSLNLKFRVWTLIPYISVSFKWWSCMHIFRNVCLYYWRVLFDYPSNGIFYPAIHGVRSPFIGGGGCIIVKTVLY